MSKVIGLLIVLYIALSPSMAIAQQAGDFGVRVRSKDGKWLLPVATRINGSDEEKHVNRGSVLAWDLVAPMGSPIYAMGPGVVEYAGCDNRGGYGCWIFVNHSEFKAVYGHAISGSIVVKAGQRVDANSLLGQVGMTGMTSFGPHTHLEMQKPGGGRFRIDAWFDRAQMRFCSLCSVKGEPAVATGTTQSIAAANPQVAMAPRLAMPVNNVSGYAFLIFVFFLARYVFSTNPRRFRGSNMLRDIAVSVVIIVMPIWIPFWSVSIVGSAPAATQTSSASPNVATTLPAGGAWEVAYNFVTKWEGRKCTEDGAHTYAGVTQGAFNRYNKRHGLPQADVCGNLTEEVKKGIFYEDYWLASGADKLPSLIAIAHADFSYNVGVGEKGPAMRILTQCGTDVACYIKERYNWYRTQCRNCSAGHINRTNDVVKLLQGLVK